MASYTLETKLSPERAIEQAVAYFGQDGLGLEVTEQGACCAGFVGGGGHVYVAVSAGPKTKVDLETREWDYDVKRFMRRMG
jgi:hypothetical protein